MIFIKNCTDKEFKMEFTRENNESYKIVKKRKYNSEKIELKNELKSAFFVSEDSIEFYESEMESEMEFKSKEFISESDLESDLESEKELESDLESEFDEDLIDDMDIDPDMDLRSVDENDYGYYDEDDYGLGYEDECYECFEI